MGFTSDTIGIAGGDDFAAKHAEIDAAISQQRHVVGTIQMTAAVNHTQSLADLGNEFSDVFTDETGVNTGTSTMEYDGTSDYYKTPANDTVLQVQSDTTNGSTTFVDAGGAYTITPNLGAQHITSGATIGATRMDLSGNNNLEIGLTDALDLGSGSFNLECKVEFNSVSGVHAIYSAGTVSNGHTFYINGTSLYWKAYNPTSGSMTWGNVHGMTTGTVYDIAISRDGNDWEMFVDGASIGTTTNSVDMATPTTRAEIGAQFTVSYLDGYMEEFQLTTTSAIRTGAYTPPVVAYPAPTNGPFLLQSAAQTVVANPTKGFIVVRHEAVDAVTMNTDFTAKISIDNGVTFTSAVTLTFFSVYDSDSDIYVSGEVDVSAQTGSQVVIKYETANSKSQRIHGHYFGVAA